MKINQSRKSTQSIMCNPHFEGVLLKKGEAELFIPKSWIFSDGRLKGYAQVAWKKELAKYEFKKVV